MKAIRCTLSTWMFTKFEKLTIAAIVLGNNAPAASEAGGLSQVPRALT